MLSSSATDVMTGFTEDYGGPLDGVRVIDASSVIAGPLTGALFGLLGAEVIKIEMPGDGDRVRLMGPKAAPTTYWSFLAQDKKCISCKMSSPKGAALVRRLVEQADVFIENFRPGTLERWGLGPDELHAVNPRLTILRMTGFGQDGPYADRPGYGTLAEAMSGLAHMNGEPGGPPILPGVALGDIVTGLTAAVAGLASVVEGARSANGGGSVVDVSIFESVSFFLTPMLIEAQATGVAPTRKGSRAFGGAPRNAAQCADGRWVAYSIQARGLLNRLVDFLGLQGDPHYDTSQDPAVFGDDLDQALQQWLSEHERDEAVAILVGAGLPIAPINDADDLLSDAHLEERGDLVSVDDTEHGSLTVLGSPVRIDGWRREPRATGFPVGAHNRVVYGGMLGISDDELKELEEDGII